MIEFSIDFSICLDYNLFSLHWGWIILDSRHVSLLNACFVRFDEYCCCFLFTFFLLYWYYIRWENLNRKWKHLKEDFSVCWGGKLSIWSEFCTLLVWFTHFLVNLLWWHMVGYKDIVETRTSKSFKRFRSNFISVNPPQNILKTKTQSLVHQNFTKLSICIQF
jgi:hypothetical protein